MGSTTYAGLTGLLQQKSAFDHHFAQYASDIADLEIKRRTLCRRIANQIVYQANDAFDLGKKSEAYEYLQIALQVCPELSRWRASCRIRLKRALGPTLWLTARWLAHRMKLKQERFLGVEPFFDRAASEEFCAA
jgi:hypothetical protein